MMNRTIDGTNGPVTELSVAGKTFLVGEYLAMSGGPSVVVTTAPRFSLRVSALTNASTETPPFSPQSPAGKFMALHGGELGSYHFEFLDPHEGRGGLGASSAQFALLYAFFHRMEKVDLEFSWNDLLTEYHSCAWDGVGRAPSGADVVAQLSGLVTVYDGTKHEAHSVAWPFEDLSFTLLRTGQKLATHEHLKTASATPAGLEHRLRAIVVTAMSALESSSEVSNESANETAFVQAINEYGLVLKESGLLAPTTLALLEHVRATGPEVLAAKGCGAMGADVALILHRRNLSNEFLNWATKNNVEVCGSDRDLSDGLKAN